MKICFNQVDTREEPSADQPGANVANIRQRVEQRNDKFVQRHEIRSSSYSSRFQWSLMNFIAFRGVVHSIEISGWSGIAGHSNRCLVVCSDNKHFAHKVSIVGSNLLQ